MVAFLASIVCLAIAPAALPGGYSVVEHTISEAGAQATEGAWLTQTGFLLFGLGVLCLSVVKRGWPSSARFLNGAFGLFMIATGVYSHRPYLDGVSYDQVENLLHSVAAGAMGLSFVLGVLVVGWRRIPRWKIIDIVALIAAMGIPVTIVTTNGADGLLHRGIFLVAYVWYGLELKESRRRTAFDTFG